MAYEEKLKSHRQISGDVYDTCCLRVDQSGFTLRGIRAVGVGKYRSDYEVETFAATCHLALYVTTGVVHCETKDQQYQAKPGELITVPAGGLRRLYSHGQVAYLWIHLEDNELYRHLHLQGVSVQPAPECDAILSYVDDYRKEIVNSSIIGPYHEIIGEKVLRLFADPALNEIRQALQMVVEQIQLHPTHSWTVDEMSAICRLSKGHFHKLCQEHLDTTPMRLVLRVRLERGATLLRTSTLTVEAIASDCGFSSARSFSQAFLREHGERPGAFRASSSGQ
ncbi:MAG: AraC family transcriptional regulator [Verrucomicrobiota bacterium]